MSETESGSIRGLLEHNGSPDGEPFLSAETLSSRTFDQYEPLPYRFDSVQELSYFATLLLSTKGLPDRHLPNVQRYLWNPETGESLMRLGERRPTRLDEELNQYDNGFICLRAVRTWQRNESVTTFEADEQWLRKVRRQVTDRAFGNQSVV